MISARSLLIAILICTFSFQLFSEEKRIALVIGNNDYEYATGLRNPVNDARSISENLRLMGFEVLFFSDLNLRDMKQNIDLFGEKLKSFEVGLFYYSGHGIQLNGYNYLVPVDANLSSETDAEYDCLDVGRILSKMENSDTRTNIIILDACRNNPFEKSWSRNYKKAGLAFMDAPTGSLIAYSTSPGSTASDGDGENGLYTRYLLGAMINPELNILQVFQEVRKKVREDSGGKQVPWESTSLESDFYFNQSGRLLIKSEKNVSSAERRTDEKEIRQQIDKIQSDSMIIWSEGWGKTLSEADKAAEEALNKKMSDYLKAKVRKVTSFPEMQDALERGISLLTEEYRSFAFRKITESRKGTSVVKYLSKTDMIQNLDSKKNRILAFTESAAEAEQALRIADALKYYYWAYSLSSVFPGEIRMPVKDNKPIIGYLEDRIRYLIGSVNFIASDSVTGDIYKSFKIHFKQGEKLLENINFRYWNGVSWSEIVYANAGTAGIDIYPSYFLKDVKISIEYANISESGFDPYLNKSILVTNNNPFRDERKVSFDTETPRIQKTVSDEARQMIDKLLTYFKTKQQKYDPSVFTEEGFDIYRKLLLYGNATVFSGGNSYWSYSMDKFTYVRGLPCTFSFKNNSVKFSENLCFEFTSDGRINNIAFELADKSVNDIMNQERWPLLSRLQIIRFLENYKTAYALKRSDYIEKIFSDNALIIVGQRIEVAEEIDGSKYSLSGDNYEFTKLTKEQYLYRLRNVFRQNEFINIRFEENVVKKRDNQSDVYGINIRQNYFSSGYADQGYLFLMVDMKEPSRPMIYVRSWQPLKFDNKNIINLSDFTY